MLDKSLLPGKISAGQFRGFLRRYEAVISSISAAKPPKAGHMTLAELDQFRFGDAIKLFGSPRPQRAMGLDDVKVLVDWKLRHGKFRPSLPKLVASNDAETAKQTIAAAMKAYWETQADGKDDDQKYHHPSAALDALCKLKGIGPATASLLLSVHDPDRVIFFSDEAYHWLCCRGEKATIKYSAKEYRDLDAAAQAVVEELGVSAAEVEKVAYVLFRLEDGSVVPPEEVEESDAVVGAEQSSMADEAIGAKRKKSGMAEEAAAPATRSKRGRTS